MTRQQLGRAFVLATSSEDLTRENYDNLCGFGLPGFNPVFTTVRAVARLIRWQCVQLNGGIDSRALSEIAELGRTRFQIVA